MHLSLMTLRTLKEKSIFSLLCDLLIYQQLTLEAVSHLAVQLLNIDKDAFVLCMFDMTEPVASIYYAVMDRVYKKT